MNSPILIPFEPFHLDHFRPGAIDKIALAGIDINVFSENWNGKAVSAIFGGRVIGIAGIGKVRDGVGRAWLLLSDEARRHPVFLHRSVKRGLDTISREMGLSVIEVTVADCFSVGIKWAERLGFEFHAKGKDFVRMSKWFSH